MLRAPKTSARKIRRLQWKRRTFKGTRRAFFKEHKRRGVQAIPQACWLGTIFKYVSKMGVATGAINLYALHSHVIVFFITHMIGVKWREETWPPRS